MLAVATKQSGFDGLVIGALLLARAPRGPLAAFSGTALASALVFAGLFVLAALGVAIYVIFSLIEGRVTGWATRKNDVIAT